LLGTKLRALYQRKKGRDLYDLWLALRSGEPSSAGIVECFQQYMVHDGTSVSRAEFEANLSAKLGSTAFLEDIRLLLQADTDYDPVSAARIVAEQLIVKLPGEPWRGGGP
jgi:hypothetical protein